MVNLSYLGSHLQEILQTTQASVSTLSPSLLSDNLYRSDSVVGGFLHYTWGAISLMNWSYDKRNTAFLTTIQKIYATWSDAFAELEQHLLLLNRSFRAYIEEDREEITDHTWHYMEEWHNQVGCLLIEKNLKLKDQALLSILQFFSLDESLPRRTYRDRARIEQNLLSAEQLFQLFLIKQIVKRTIPLSVIEKVIEDRPLAVTEKLRFEEYAVRLKDLVESEQCHDRLSTIEFHQMNQALIHHLFLSPHLKRGQILSRLYWHLSYVFKIKGSKYFEQVDHLYVEYLEKINQGEIACLSIDGHMLQLTAELQGNTKPFANKHRVFALADNHREVVRFSNINLFQLFIELEERRRSDYAIPIYPCHAIDEQFGALIKRGLSDSCLNYRWSEDPDSLRFERRLTSFITLIRHMKENRYMPKYLDLSRIHFDENDQLIFTDFVTTIDFSFIKVVLFIQSCFLNDHQTYKRVLESSLLLSYPAIKLCKDIIQAALERDKDQIGSLVSLLHHNESVIMQDIQMAIGSFVYSLEHMMESTKTVILRHYLVLDHLALDKKMQEILFASILEFGILLSTHFLDPVDYKDRVVSGLNLALMT